MQIAVSASDDPVDSLLIGGSQAMSAVRSLIRRVAPSAASVLILGPSGSGKELVARALHAASPRRDGPFIAVNCSAIPRDLLESELFGHERGSFTGAHGLRIGRFEQAHGGTLFLDEIGDMPTDMQVKLLRVLEERSVERVGGRASVRIDVRIVSATHRNLDEAIVAQRFREDLFYRLAVFPIRLPALSGRRDDIALLARQFATDFGIKLKQCTFDASAIRQLALHTWPGNVRELRNFVERASILHPGATLSADDVKALLLPVINADFSAAFQENATERTIANGIDLKVILAGIEGHYIKEALDLSAGVVSDAARLLGLRRTTLVEKIRRYEVAA